MKYGHTRARRLVAAIVVAGGAVLALTLALSARSATHHAASPTATVSFYHQNTKLGSRDVPAGTKFDVVWQKPGCSNGYVSPPVAFTWTSAKTGATGAPVMAPCNSASKFTWPDDWECVLTIGPPPNHDLDFECHWTYDKKASTSSLRIPNPSGAGVGTLYLYKRTALYAWVRTPGQPDKKVSVPAGADTIKFAVAG